MKLEIFPFHNRDTHGQFFPSHCNCRLRQSPVRRWLQSQHWQLFRVEVEATNIHDRYVCAVAVNGQMVGHMPGEFSKTVYYFIQKKNNGIVRGSVTGRKEDEYSTHERLRNALYLWIASKKKIIRTLKKLLRANFKVLDQYWLLYNQWIQTDVAQWWLITVAVSTTIILWLGCVAFLKLLLK